MSEIRLANPVLTKEMKDAALQAMETEKFVLGESVYRFEEALAQYLSVDQVISVSSGTHALQFALIAAGVTGGAPVLTVPNSFIATANAALHAGGTPVFCDINPTTYTMDPTLIEARRGAPAVAIVPVHLFGHPCDMPRIAEEAERISAPIIEDAAQAHGATVDGTKVGAFGLAGCFSFYPSKNLTVGGDGGAVSTNDTRVADTVRKLRDCGRTSRYEHDIIGYTARLNTVNAAIGLVQLRNLDQWNERRRTFALQYGAGLRNLPEIALPPSPTSRMNPVYHLYVVRARQRDKLKHHLAAAGVETAIHYPIPIHLQPAYRALFGYHGGEFPHSEQLATEVLSLPCHPGLARNDVRYICRTIRGFYEGG